MDQLEALSSGARDFYSIVTTILIATMLAGVLELRELGNRRPTWVLRANGLVMGASIVIGALTVAAVPQALMGDDVLLSRPSVMVASTAFLSIYVVLLPTLVAVAKMFRGASGDDDVSAR